MLTRKMKAEWVAALRSGEYKQSRQSRLRTAEDEYDPFGVLQALNGGFVLTTTGFASAKDRYYATPDKELWCPDTGCLDEICAMHDHHGLSFAEIADWIEENVNAVKDEDKTEEVPL